MSGPEPPLDWTSDLIYMHLIGLEGLELGGLVRDWKVTVRVCRPDSRQHGVFLSGLSCPVRLLVIFSRLPVPKHIADGLIEAANQAWNKILRAQSYVRRHSQVAAVKYLG